MTDFSLLVGLSVRNHTINHHYLAGAKDNQRLLLTPTPPSYLLAAIPQYIRLHKIMITRPNILLIISMEPAYCIVISDLVTPISQASPNDIAP